MLQAGIKCAAHNALRYHAKDRNNGSRSQHYDPRVPVDRDDFDETWVPLMDLSAEDCRAQVTVQVDHVDRDIRDVQMRFTDVAPKVFLQIRHAAGVSSREYADVLGKALEPTTLPVSSVAEQCLSSSGRSNVQIDQDQENLLIEKLTEGRGGAFFYYSHDRCRVFDFFAVDSGSAAQRACWRGRCCCFTRTFRRFVIKTITDGEFNVRVFIVLTC